MPFFKWTTNLFQLGVFGFTNAYIDLSTNLFVFELFQEDRLNLHVQIVHFSLSIGQTVGPLLLGPFLAASRESVQLDHNQTIFSNNDMIIQHTAIFIPFTVGGCLFMACSIAMFVCWFIAPYVQPKRIIKGRDIDLAKQNELGSKPDELRIPHRSFYVLFVSLVLCLIGTESLAEYFFLYFISIHLSNYLKIEGTSNTNLIALIGVFYIVGRGFSVLVSTIIGPTKMLILNTSLILVGSTLFVLINSSTSYLFIAIASIIMGCGFSSALPSLYSFIEQRIHITTTLNCCMLCVSCLLFSIESFRVSSIMSSSPDVFKYMNLFYSIAFAICFVLILSTDYTKNTSLKTIKPPPTPRKRHSTNPGWDHLFSCVRITNVLIFFVVQTL